MKHLFNIHNTLLRWRAWSYVVL